MNAAYFDIQNQCFFNYIIIRYTCACESWIHSSITTSYLRVTYKGRFILCRRPRAACGRFIHFWKFHSAISGNAAKVMESWNMFYSVRPAACGKVWTSQANSLILLFVRPAAKYEPALTGPVCNMADYYYRSCMYSY